jgi:hypothetical protein
MVPPSEHDWFWLELSVKQGPSQVGPLLRSPAGNTRNVGQPFERLSVAEFVLGEALGLSNHCRLESERAAQPVGDQAP